MAVYDAADQLSGGAVLIYQDDVVFLLHGNVLSRARASSAGPFLYWSVLERGMQKGCSSCDFGRSLVGSGNEEFKFKWSPQKRPLAYWYCLAPGHQVPTLNQANSRLQFAIATWKRLPGFVVRSLGPHIIRGLA